LLGGDNEDSPDVAHNNVDVLGHWFDEDWRQFFLQFMSWV
jgi:hypothetical protein